jgi:DNA repair ATPase RecN
LKVEIHNFQAIAEATFEIDGFTALVGRSNIGKSAVVRALKCALTGAEGTDFVRHDPATCARILKGNKKCKCASSVKLTADEWTLLWEKGDAINQYTTWDASGKKQVYSRVGRNPEMPPLLRGFDPVKLGDRGRELVQVSDQFTPIFLLNLPGTVVADLLSDVAQLDDINKAMRLVTKDRKEAASTRKVREKDIKVLEHELTVYATLDNTAKKVQSVEDKHAALEGKSEQVEQVGGFLFRAAEVTRSMRSLKQALQGDLPASDDLTDKSGRLKTISGFLQERAQVIKGLKGVDDLVVPEAQDLGDRVDRLKEVGSKLDRLRDLKQALTTFKGFDEVEVPATPETAGVLEALGSLAGFQARLAELEASIEKTEGLLESATQEEADVLEEFEALGVCPTCTQKVGPGHFEEDHV